MIVDLYTPGLGAEHDRQAVALDPADLYTSVPCWGGCEDGVYNPECGLPDAGFPCVECRGTGERLVAIL